MSLGETFRQAREEKGQTVSQVAEVKAHPIASTAALLTAAAALIGLLASTRRKTTD